MGKYNLVLCGELGHMFIAWMYVIALLFRYWYSVVSSSVVALCIPNIFTPFSADTLVSFVKVPFAPVTSTVLAGKSFSFTTNGCPFGVNIHARRK